MLYYHWLLLCSYKYHIIDQTFISTFAFGKLSKKYALNFPPVRFVVQLVFAIFLTFHIEIRQDLRLIGLGVIMEAIETQQDDLGYIFSSGDWRSQGT